MDNRLNTPWIALRTWHRTDRHTRGYRQILQSPDRLDLVHQSSCGTALARPTEVTVEGPAYGFNSIIERPKRQVTV